MTRSTSVMRIGSCAYQSVVMTAGTVRCSYLHQGTMIYRCMRRIPTVCMTRLAVARRSEVFSDRITYKCTGPRVMAVGAVGKMRVCRDKSICMTGRTVRRARCRYKAAVVNNMDRIPARAVTVRTVAAR